MFGGLRVRLLFNYSVFSTRAKKKNFPVLLFVSQASRWWKNQHFVVSKFDVSQRFRPFSIITCQTTATSSSSMVVAVFPFSKHEILLFLLDIDKLSAMSMTDGVSLLNHNHRSSIKNSFCKHERRSATKSESASAQIYDEVIQTRNNVFGTFTAIYSDILNFLALVVEWKIQKKKKEKPGHRPCSGSFHYDKLCIHNLAISSDLNRGMNNAMFGINSISSRFARCSFS